MTFTLATYQFMREQAGYSWRPSIETEAEGRTRCALELARAEYALGKHPSADVQWTREADFYAETEQWCATLTAHSEDGSTWEPLASLGGIDAPAGDPYRRVIEAELALEAGVCHPLDQRIYV